MLNAYNAERCGECGVHPDQWSPKYGADPRHPLTVPKWVYCPVCFLAERLKKKCPETDKDGNPGPGWRLILVPRDEA